MNSDSPNTADIVERYRSDILALDEARSNTIYGGLSFRVISDAASMALKNAGLIQTLIPAGSMGLLTKLTPKGVKAAAALKDHRKAQAHG